VPERETRRALAAVGGAFAAHAIQAGSLGPWIPTLTDRAGIGAGGLGLALTALAAGLLVGTRLAAPAIRRAGSRRVVRVAVPVLAAIFAVVPAASSLPQLSAVFLGLGIASGVVDVAMNDAAVLVEGRARRRVMSAIHGTWSVATLVGAALATLALVLDVPVGISFASVALLVGAVTLPLLRWLPAPGGPPVAHPVGSSAAGDDAPRNGVVLALCAIAAAAFMAEGTALEWSAVYLRDDLGATAGAAGAGVVAFTAGMAASRFVGDRLATRFGASGVVRAGAGAGALVLAGALAVGGVPGTLVAFALLGACLGPIVPLVFSTAGRLARGRGRSALPVVVTSAYTGSVVGPVVLGITAEVVGLRVALLLPVVAAVVIAVLARRVDVAAPPPG
jgi:MFS family permease